MQRRTTAILLIVFGLVIIIGVVVWLLWPSVQDKISSPQPPGYTDQPLPAEPIQTEPTPLPQVTDPALIESRRLEDRLRRLAQEFASRSGSYSNSDNFAALRDAGLNGTAGVRTFFASEQRRLSAEHPVQSGPWGQTARGLASKITSPTPIRDQSEVTVEVDAQIITEAGSAAPATSYRKALMMLQKSGDTWLVSQINWVET